MNRLILMRHGESVWNKNNLFTGWVDVPLSPKGIEEALEGGKLLNEIPIDIVITTTLVRAQTTAFLALAGHSSGKTLVVQHENEDKQSRWSCIHSEKTKEKTIPVYYCWELNERMYGDLQGLNKAEIAEKYGKEQVHQWRRSYDIPPPGGESLKLTAERSIPYFEKVILPLLDQGKSVFVSAHGNSLRSIIMDLDNLSEEEVLKLEVPTGKPIVYNYKEGSLIRDARFGLP